MALPREYTGENCSIARALEVVGERWTLLIVRDAFYGVSRFSDFRDHLRIPRAVLAERLSLLVEHDILTRVTAASGRAPHASQRPPASAVTGPPQPAWVKRRRWPSAV